MKIFFAKFLIFETFFSKKSPKFVEIISLQDVNDQRPVFAEERYEVNVTEVTEVGVALLNVSASDGDIGENARLTYSVAAGGVVSVGGVSGEVELVRGLDHEDTSRWEIEVRGRERIFV